MNLYDEKYNREDFYWGVQPSRSCLEVLKIFPPDIGIRLMDIGCGEGRNAVFFARNGYNVTAFDLSQRGVEKTQILAQKAGVNIQVFQADIKDYRLSEEFQIIFSTGTLQYIPSELRTEVLSNYKRFTAPNGINVFSILLDKPFIPKAPDQETTTHKWISGEIFTYYHDWRIEYCIEDIFDCRSIEIPHKHAVNRMIARKVSI